MRNACLFCLLQELLTLETPCKDVNEKEGLPMPASSLQPATFFSTLLAKHRSSDVEKPRVDTEQQLGVPGATAIKEV
jgi:hypothetical protein